MKLSVVILVTLFLNLNSYCIDADQGAIKIIWQAKIPKQYNQLKSDKMIVPYSTYNDGTQIKLDLNTCRLSAKIGNATIVFFDPYTNPMGTASYTLTAKQSGAKKDANFELMKGFNLLFAGDDLNKKHSQYQIAGSLFGNESISSVLREKDNKTYPCFYFQKGNNSKTAIDNGTGGIRRLFYGYGTAQSLDSTDNCTKNKSYTKVQYQPEALYQNADQNGKWEMADSASVVLGKGLYIEHRPNPNKRKTEQDTNIYTLPSANLKMGKKDCLDVHNEVKKRFPAHTIPDFLTTEASSSATDTAIGPKRDAEQNK